MANLIKNFFTSSASPVIFTLLGVIISSSFTWLGNYQSSKMIYKTSCIARADQQEAQLREKYSSFLIALSNFSFSPEILDVSSEKEFRKIAMPLAAAAMDMTAYTPGSMTLIAMKVTQALNFAVMAGNDPTKQEQAIQMALKSSNGSYEAYHLSLDEIDKQRKNCG
ncbi:MULTISPECIES: hypothetical protein [unclassified Pantoea]|uniref:hypothetical protein n=1 Tax=unclassified Pantoea TaxID=2630326 RepID=UPI0025566B89|nr:MULTISPECIES: hypothetical protein [unclassified Pantoea]